MKRWLAICYGFGLSLLPCVPFAGAAAGQGTATVGGVVTTLGPDGQPVSIPGAILLLQCEHASGVPVRATTDESGSYSIAAPAPGRCRVTASAPGFREQTKDVELIANTTVESNIQLELESVVQKVEVKEREETLATESSTPASTLQREQLENLPMLEQTFRDALRVVPGVIRSNDGKLNIRGSAETQGMLQVNSVETVDPVT